MLRLVLIARQAKKSKTMINSNEKLKYSISVDSLALLSARHLANAEIQWDPHSNNIGYSKNLESASIGVTVKKLKSKGNTIDGITEYSVEENSIKEAKAKIESIFKKMRADLNSGKGKLVIEQVDTAECNKIRITIESAVIWASDILEIDISAYFPHATVEDDDSKFKWGVTKTKNNLEFVAIMLDLLIKNQKQPKTSTVDQDYTFASLLKQIAEHCQTVEGADKIRSIRNLLTLASAIKKDRNAIEN